MTKRFWIRYKKKENIIESQTTKLGQKPKGSGWKRVFVAGDCCTINTDCIKPVQFNCIDSSFFLEIINPETNVVISSIYQSDSEVTNFLEQIPRGIYTLRFNSVTAGASVFINNEVVGTGDGNSIEFENYDTTTITQMGYCDETGITDVVIDFQYIQAGSPEPRTPEQVAERVKFQIYAADGITLLGETELGGGNNQVIPDVPYGNVIICLVADSFEASQMLQYTALNTVYGGGSLIFRLSVEGTGTTCAGAPSPLTTQYRMISSGLGNG